MCGIFGFSGFSSSNLLEKMSQTLHHRGPDSGGFFRSEDQVFLGMRRLSIIDLAEGEQPIYNEDHTMVVVFNGEIYNYLEIRDELKRAGHIFRTNTDTEVIVHAYEEWGVSCLEHFNGMFALALYDKRAKKLFIARDRCGQKPLYYYFQNGHLVFASEIKAILLCDFIPREVNIPAIDAYLALRYVPEPRTLLQHVHILPAAHFLELTDNRDFKIQRYWDINLVKNNQFLSTTDAMDKVQEKLEHAVQLVMRSDVPVGAYLSGGIDSTLLVALMSRHHPRINTYSIGFNSSIDETVEAKESAALIGTNHHEIHCDPNDFELLPKIIYHMDRPVGDALIIAFYKLSQLASQDLKVVVSGEGADEIFAGYQFHKVLQLMKSYHQIIPQKLHHKVAMPLLSNAPDKLLNMFFNFPASLGKQGKQIFLDFFSEFQNNSLFHNYVALKTLWRKDARKDLYSEKFKHLATTSWIPEERDTEGHFLDRLLKLQWTEWLQDWSIIRQDKNAMAHSLEVRLPFLDHELIELSFRINPKMKATWFKDKIIERKLAKALLPKQVINRPKKPFFFPLEYFYKNPKFTDLVKLTLNKQQIEKRGYFNADYVTALVNKMQAGEFVYLKQVMSLVILELWHMVFIDRIALV